MKAIVCKAVSKGGEWVYGYPFETADGAFIYSNENKGTIAVHPESFCYGVGESDKNGVPLFTGDIINDFDGGVYVPDQEHPTYHPDQAFPPMKLKEGSDPTRLGTIIWEEGTIRVETNELDYAYNISQECLKESEVVGNQFDHLITKI